MVPGLGEQALSVPASIQIRGVCLFKMYNRILCRTGPLGEFTWCCLRSSMTSRQRLFRRFVGGFFCGRSTHTAGSGDSRAQDDVARDRRVGRCTRKPYCSLTLSSISCGRLLSSRPRLCAVRTRLSARANNRVLKNVRARCCMDLLCCACHPTPFNRSYKYTYSTSNSSRQTPKM